MFIAILFITIGICLLLNALGILVGTSFWTFIWAVFFIVIGIKMMMKKSGCPMCGWQMKEMHGKMQEKCCGGHNHKHDEEMEEEVDPEQ